MAGTINAPTPPPGVTPSAGLTTPSSGTTITPESLSAPTSMQTSTVAPDTTNHNAITTSVTQGVIDDYNNLTKPADDTATSNQNSLSQSITDLMNSESGKAADTQAANTASGVDDATNDVNTYTAQLADLNSQASQLKNEASAVPIQTQQNNQNTGATDAGIAPQNAGALRENALKALSIGQQADIAQAALTGSNIRLQAAQAKAQQMIDLKYQPIEAQLQAKQAQYTMNKDALDSLDKKASDELSVSLQKEATDTANQKQADTDVSNIAIEAAKNGASPAIVKAIQATTNVGDAVVAAGSSLSDTIGNQLKAAQLQGVLLDNQKKVQDAQSSGANSVIQTNPVTGSSISIPLDVAPYHSTASNGVDYVDASALQGTAAEKAQIIADAQKAGLKVILNKDNSADLQNIGNARDGLTTITNALSQIAASSPAARDTYAAGKDTLSKFLQTDPNKAAFQSFELIAPDIAKAISGLRGYRANATLLAEANADIPQLTDTLATIKQKTANLNSLLTDRENNIVGTPSNGSQPKSTGQSDSDFVNSSLNSQGVKYSDAIKAVPSGKIGVIDNTSGQVGYLDSENEFDSSKYTKL